MKTTKIILLLAGIALVSGTVNAQYYLKNTLTSGIGPKYFAYNSDSGKIYVSNTGESTIGILKNYTYQPLTLAFGPSEMEYNPVTRKLYVGMGFGSVYILNGDDDQLDTTLSVSTMGAQVGCNPVANKLYANSSTYGLYIYDATTYAQRYFAVGFEGNIYYQPGGSVYIAHGYDTLIGVYNSANDTIADTIGFSGINSASEMVGSPEMKKLYVTLPTYNQVGIVDANTNSLITKVTVGTNPVAMAYSPDHKKIYVACLGDNRLWMIDSMNVTSNIFVGDSVNAVVYNPVSKHICFSDKNNSQLKILDPVGDFVLQTITLPTINPAGLMIDPTNGDIYAALTGVGGPGTISITGYDPLAPIGATLYDIPSIINTNNLTVFWSPGTDQGGSGIIYYELYIQPDSSEPYFNIYYPPDTSAGLGMNDSTMYHLMVVARDSAGNPLNVVYDWQDSVYVDYSYVPPVVSSTDWKSGVYRLFSIPLKVADSSATILLGDDLGAYGPSNWRLFGYSTATESFIERPYVFNGKGYWMASMKNATLDVTGTENDPLTAIKLPLYSGWNLIGVPFTSQFYLADIEVSSALGWLPYTDSLSWVYVDPRMWYYTDNTADLINNGIWDSLSPLDVSASLLPWGGYALYAALPCSLSIGSPIGKTQQSEQKGPVYNIDWQLEISARCGIAIDQGLKIGVSPQAKEKYDRLDAAKPPLVSDQIKIYLPHDDWDRGPCRQYLYDFRPSGEYMEWPLVVENSETGNGELTFQLEGSLSPGYKLYLVNRTNNNSTEITDNSRVGFTGSQTYLVIYTDKDISSLNFKPLSFVINKPAPNPFSRSLAISYQIPEVMSVKIAVYNISGQRIKILADEWMAPGYYKATWDGRDETGRNISTGIYFVRIIAGNNTLTQKILKIK